MSRISRNIHVDTQYVYAYVIPDGNDDENHLKQQIRLALVNHNPEIQVKISFVALGETMNIINKKAKGDGWKKRAVTSFFELLRHEKVDIIPPTLPIFEVAKKIKNEDSRLGYTDVLIVAHALCDKESYLALFHDANIINSLVIQELCNERKSDANFYYHLEIREEFR
jgi:predicted nucleic acid-binding protein